MTEMIDPDGNYTIDEYDGYNRLTLADEYNSSSTLVNYQSYTYDAIGNPSVTYTADSRTTDLYNDQGQLTSELVYDVGTLSTTMVSSSDTTYLASGLVATSTDGDGNVTSNTYDQVGRLTDVEVLDASTGHQQRDQRIRPGQPHDAANRRRVTTTSYGYDADGNVTFQETLDASHNPVAESKSGYNADDELTSSTDGYGNVTKYGYSAGLQTSQATYASTNLSSPISSETWAYDTARDNTLAIDAAGNTTSSLYDGDHHLTFQAVYDGGTTISSASWQYDPTGNMTYYLDGDGNTTDYQYDGDGRVIEQSVYNAASYLVSEQTWGYDKDGNQTLYIDPDSNTTDSTYSDGMLVTQVLPIGTESWQYDQAQQQTLYIDPDGIATLSQYDGAGNMVSETIYTGSQTTTQSWGYDKAGNQTLYIDPDGIVTDSSYDGDQLTLQVTAATSTLSWGYDKAGNQTAAVDADGYTTTSVYDGGQLVRQEVGSLDNETFGYDLDGQQTSLIDADGNTTISQYDALGDMT